jgi:hypothetical protein
MHRSLSAVLAVAVLSLPLGLAAEPPSKIAAGVGEQSLRFLASPAACQVRAQLVSASGETVFDSSWQDGNLLDWPVVSAMAALPAGAYRCVVSSRDLDGNVAANETGVSVDSGHITLAALPDGANAKVSLLAHDGTAGALVTTSGDLAFRFGDVLRGKDAERMRVTAEGNVGIGTAKPQAPLDVNGLIRTNKGIVFPDGTILTTAAGLPGEATDAAPVGSRTGAPARPAAALLIPGAVGALGGGLRGATPRPNVISDYQFRVDSAGVHVGSTQPFALSVTGDAAFYSNIGLVATTATAGIITSNGQPFIHRFGSNNFFAGLSAGNLTLTGTRDTGLGPQTLSSLTSGNDNTAVGFDSLKVVTSAFNNTAVGSYSMFATTTGVSNTAVGMQALYSNVAGGANSAFGAGALVNNLASSNTAVGNAALLGNTSGASGTAVGASALLSNTTGSFNTAVGESALFQNSTGTHGTAVGYQSLYASTADDNTAEGYQSLSSDNSGAGNTGVGYLALNHNTTGNYNVALGEHAGWQLTTGCCNIDIGNAGVAGEAATIRIGNGNQTRAFVTGIRGITTGTADGVPVLIDSNGQLGTASSSRRFKFDINDAGDSTSGLLRLRPVTFRYLAYGAGSPLQYGLIAEEVAEVYPELVTRGKDGQVETVMYQFLAPMLLNELQKEHGQITAQQKQIDALTDAIASLSRRLRELEKTDTRR